MTNITQLCFVIAPLVLGLSSQNIVISSALTRTVADADTGKLYSMTHNFES